MACLMECPLVSKTNKKSMYSPLNKRLFHISLKSVLAFCCINQEQHAQYFTKLNSESIIKTSHGILFFLEFLLQKAPGSILINLRLIRQHPKIT